MSGGAGGWVRSPGDQEGTWGGHWEDSITLTTTGLAGMGKACAPQRYTGPVQMQDPQLSSYMTLGKLYWKIDGGG